jgi:TM2 domain-containing membrane protein YozV
MAVCPYCRTPIEEGQASVCEGCGTPHHPECLAENGGCTLFGCKFAPPDDPKLQVTSGDLSHAGAYGPQAMYAAATGFGDIAGPIAVAPALADLGPPPPPPPGTELRPEAERPTIPVGGSTLFAAPELKPKSRLAFILLGIFLGSFGVHNFYAGYIKRGVAQLCLTVLTFFYASVIAWIWALVEVCTVDRDRDNINFV